MAIGDVHPLTERCAGIVADVEHVVLGLSPFNSYYRPSTVDMLIDWAVARFERVDVLLPGYEIATTLVAAGVEPFAAVRRARRAVHDLRKPALRALGRHGVAHPEHHVRTWTTFVADPVYRALRKRVAEVYQHDPYLRTLCRGVCHQVIASATAGRGSNQIQLDRAVAYVMSEIPFLLDSPALYRTPRSVFIYHRIVDLAAALFAGAVPTLVPAPGQAFAAVTTTSVGTTPVPTPILTGGRPC